MIEPPSDDKAGEVTPRLLVETVLATKLRRPPVRAGTIPRGRVIAGLERGASCSLTVVAAPAGYGKTTAVSQWLEASGRVASTSWVTLDAHDDEPVRLWTLVATSLQSIGQPIARDTATFVSAHQHDIEGRVLPQIATAMAAGGITVVIDDFDRVRSTRTAAQLDLLIRHLGPDAHLVVITRADPALRLGRLRATGGLFELRARDLAFTVEEATTLLSSEGLTLAATTVGDLVRRTEGWPAGIYLAALTAAGSPDPTAFVEDFAGDHRYVVDYLVEEVLSRQSTEIRRFILDVSIVDRFCAPLCEQLTGDPWPAAVLRTLQDANMFLVPLGGDPTWFRFHNLFRTVARSVLETEDPDRAVLLHGRAAHWLAANGLVGPAIEHALGAGRVGDAARMVQAHWLAYYDMGLAHEPARWLTSVADAGGDNHPSQMIAGAWMAAVTGIRTELDRRLDQLERLSYDGPMPDGAHSIESVIAMLRGQFGYRGPGPMLPHARRAAELETDGGTPWHALANNAYGHVLYVVGSLPKAVAVLARAACNQAGPAVVRIQAYALEALAYLELDQPDRARIAAAESMAVVTERSLQDVPAASLAFTALGSMQAASGEVAQAMATMESGLALRRRIPGLSPWPLVHHLLAMSKVSAMAGDLALGRTLLDEAVEILRPFDEGMAAMLGRVEALRPLLRGSRDEALAHEPLTARELEILAELDSVQSLNEIATKLFISHNTAKSHARSVYRKLGAGSRAEAIRIAHEQGLSRQPPTVS